MSYSKFDDRPYGGYDIDKRIVAYQGKFMTEDGVVLASLQDARTYTSQISASSASGDKPEAKGDGLMSYAETYAFLDQQMRGSAQQQTQAPATPIPGADTPKPQPQGSAEPSFDQIAESAYAHMADVYGAAAAKRAQDGAAAKASK